MVSCLCNQPIGGKSPKINYSAHLAGPSQPAHMPCRLTITWMLIAISFVVLCRTLGPDCQGVDLPTAFFLTDKEKGCVRHWKDQISLFGHIYRIGERDDTPKRECLLTAKLGTQSNSYDVIKVPPRPWWINSVIED